ncbi:MAG: hypothetical protein IT223_00290 [Crocinitomicaceae bacterium]|nr:hypothetical protein [Crocinitomicaceae bacterium]
MRYFTGLIFFCSLFAKAQLQSNDQRTLDYIRIECKLSDLQYFRVDSLYNEKQRSIAAYQAEVNNLQKNSTDEKMLATQVAVIQQKKKDVYDMRELELRLLLTEEQRKVYDEKVKPAKPAVLHFGVAHDRASCNVCK